MQNFVIDIDRPGVPGVVHAKEGDTNRSVSMTLYRSGEAYTPPADTTFAVFYATAAGEGNYTEGPTLAGNVLTIPLIAQMLDAPGGGAMCVIMFGADGLQLGMWNLQLEVERVPGRNSTGATQWFTALSEYVAQTLANAQEAQAQADRAQGYADSIDPATFKAADAAKLGGQLPGYYAAAENTWLLSGGKSIAENTDLHTITELGNYFCYMTSTVKTLTNCPVECAFTMTVACATGVGFMDINEYRYIRVELRPHAVSAGVVWCADATTRDYGKTWTWSEWVQVANAADCLQLTGGTLTGHVDVSPGSNIRLRLADNARYTIKTTVAGAFGIYEYDSNGGWVRTIVEVDRDGNVGTNSLLASAAAVGTAQNAANAAQNTAAAALPAASAASFLRVVSFDAATGTLTTATGVE